jgi:mediator of RNA polymerase II transcription subunit 18
MKHNAPFSKLLCLLSEQMGQAKSPDSLESVTGSYLVELSLLAPSGQDAVADEIKVFAEQLRPLVHLEKIDYRRLQQPFT